MSISRFYMTGFKMRNSQFKGKNIETSIDKLNRYFDNIFENVNFFDGAQAAVFRPENPNVFPSTSTGMLADVVLTFTDWTDNFRVDLTNPSILGKSFSKEAACMKKDVQFWQCSNPTCYVA